jgi:NAD(P)-dependent dehydrogenase (short-subunit alcohol dehydrogenase family)
VRLAGKVALVTGGGSGIGRATALRFAAEGARVAVLDRDAAAAEAVGAELGVGHLPLPCDVTDEVQVVDALARIRAQYGALNVLVNCAGVLLGAFQAVTEVERDTFSRVLEVNVVGTFLVCKHAVPLLARPGGVVLCIASHAGVAGPSSSLPYGASKSAVEGFCKTLERDLAPQGIRVNLVCPGSIDTPMKRQNVLDRAAVEGRTPDAVLAQASLGDPDGIARVLAFLASEDAGYVLGAVFTR